MAVTFILGRAGSGKTARCVRGVLEALRDPREQRRLILLVPEQASFQMERALALHAPNDGYSRASVLSFSRLAQQVWSDLGVHPPLVSRGARALALRNVTLRLAEGVETLRPATRTHGFYVQLERLVEELLREGVMPEDLRRSAAALPAGRTRLKTEEIAAIYAGYMDWLGADRVDPALRLKLLRERLEQLPWLSEAAIWVDGFAGFTGQETLTLVALARRARELHITLLLDPDGVPLDRDPDELHLFHRTVLTYRDLRAQFGAAGAAVTGNVILSSARLPRYQQSPTLARLEAGLVSADASPAPADVPPASVRVLQCQTHRDEARQAARHIRERVIESGGAVRFRDFAVIARDLAPLADTIAEVFDDFGIPYFLDRRRPLRGHPLSRLMHGLLDAAASDCSMAAMLRLMHTGLLPLTRDEAEEIEATLIEHQVRGVATWRRAAWDFEAERTLFGSGHAARPPRGRRDATHDARSRIVSALDALWQLVRHETPTTGATWARRIYECLDELDVRRRIETWIAEAQGDSDWEAAELHRLAWDALCEMLDDLHAVLGDTPARVGEVMHILSASIAECTLGLAPPTLDQVLISSIDRSRHPDIKHAWIIGFNEGLFPARPADDTLLTTAERQALTDAGSAAPKPRRDEAFDERLLAYIALTRASEDVTISFATLDEEGHTLPASSLLEDVRRALPGLQVIRCDVKEAPTTLREFVRGDLETRSRSAADPAAIVRCDRLRASLAGDERYGAALR
ncbi:MAG: exodeoxyribonuclease V subunit gamma, partial [Phycisphaerae bacterium]|nr:exodeoxyribonuclease V subunit gamma [Phycisphaerae bacterium]